MEINVQELRMFQGSEDWYNKHGEGYRIVYYYSDHYYVGTFAKTIQGFMTDFVEIAPIESEEDIPPFISIDDILTRYLNDLKDIDAVAIYKTNGEMVAKKYRSEL